MKWLQWSKIDLESGLGGVEEHARCLARELRKLGIETSFSSDPRELANDAWDVIHTHGGGIAPRKSRATRVHTLHGTTLGRMAACSEWLWPGGYLGEAREIRGVAAADVVLSVHPELSLLRMARALGKVTAVCGNGWDSGAIGNSATSPTEKSPLPAKIEAALAQKNPNIPLWLYVGRGDDIVKGADRILALLDLIPELQLITVPGAGFNSRPSLFQSGRLSASEVRSLMDRADGLLVPSRYEGNSLVVLEALASGLKVVSTPVGSSSIFLARGVEDLEVCGHGDSSAWSNAIRSTERKLGSCRSERKARAEKNQRLLPTWSSVAKSALDAVEEFRR